MAPPPLLVLVLLVKLHLIIVVLVSSIIIALPAPVLFTKLLSYILKSCSNRNFGSEFIDLMWITDALGFGEYMFEKLLSLDKKIVSYK
jgi:hypothetical protein